MDTKSLEAILGDVKRYVVRLFADFQRESLRYHNLLHTRTVVEHAMLVADNYDVRGEDVFILESAAWFHDTGHLFAEPSRHEEESIRIAGRFLLQHQLPAAIIAHIERCILATRMPQAPCTKLEKMLCDADTYHFGTDKFPAINELVKKEAALLGWDVGNWDRQTLALLEHHTYHTGYCKGLLNAGKAANIALLKERIESEA